MRAPHALQHEAVSPNLLACAKGQRATEAQDIKRPRARDCWAQGVETGSPAMVPNAAGPAWEVAVRLRVRLELEANMGRLSYLKPVSRHAMARGCTGSKKNGSCPPPEALADPMNVGVDVLRQIVVNDVRDLLSCK